VVSNKIKEEWRRHSSRGLWYHSLARFVKRISTIEGEKKKGKTLFLADAGEKALYECHRWLDKIWRDQ